MSDFPNSIVRNGNSGILSPVCGTPIAEIMAISNNSFSSTSTAWTANRAIYAPILVSHPITVYDASIVVSTQNGNVDVGIYSWSGTRIVSNGGVACAAAGVQTLALTDTTLNPGWYHLAFASDSDTAVFKSNNIATVAARASGLQQQSSAYPLPSTATFAAYTTGLWPQLAASIRTVF